MTDLRYDRSIVVVKNGSEREERADEEKRVKVSLDFRGAPMEENSRLIDKNRP